ncbi:MAG: hypothetical protein E7481_04875 [Ruminococcaceae bacterium]|nr:hypothetical protein [Oscillospiraceae bacterium]
MNKMERELRRMFRESELFYDAPKERIMNRTDGTIDMSVLKFGDVIGLKNGTRLSLSWRSVLIVCLSIKTLIARKNLYKYNKIFLVFLHNYVKIKI